MDAFERFAERPGADIGLQQVGYLFLLTDPNDVTVFEQNTALQNSMGVPSRMISAAEAGQLSTLANVDDVLAASICMRDGHATPDAVVLGYATAAPGDGRHHRHAVPGHRDRRRRRRHHRRPYRARHGVDVDSDLRRRRMVSCDRSDVRRRPAGASPSPRPIWYTEPMPDRPAHVPMTIDFTTGFYFHTEGPGLLFGMADPDQPAGFDSPMRPDWLEVVGDVVAHRAPALLEVGIAGGWHGFYETTPDHNALIGEAADVSRFIYATGFSGHGFLIGPAVGEVLRDLVMGHTPAVDVSGFDVERFKGETRPEHNVV